MCTNIITAIQPDKSMLRYETICLIADEHFVVASVFMLQLVKSKDFFMAFLWKHLG